MKKLRISVIIGELLFLFISVLLIVLAKNKAGENLTTGTIVIYFLYYPLISLIFNVIIFLRLPKPQVKEKPAEYIISLIILGNIIGAISLGIYIKNGETTQRSCRARKDDDLSLKNSIEYTYKQAQKGKKYPICAIRKFYWDSGQKDEAFNWFMKVAKHKKPYLVHHYIGVYYYEKFDFENALPHLEISADHGILEGMYLYSTICFLVDPRSDFNILESKNLNEKKAVKYLIKTAASDIKNFSDSQLFMGNICENGYRSLHTDKLLFKPDPSKALYWYEKALKNDNPNANFAIEHFKKKNSAK